MERRKGGAGWVGEMCERLLVGYYMERRKGGAGWVGEMSLVGIWREAMLVGWVYGGT